MGASGRELVMELTTMSNRPQGGSSFSDLDDVSPARQLSPGCTTLRELRAVERHAALAAPLVEDADPAGSESDGKFFWHRGPLGTAVASGLVLGLLNMTLNLSLAAVVFDSKSEFIGLGFDINCFSCGIASLTFAFFSKCPLYVGCPNAPAAIVFHTMMHGLVADLKDEEERVMPTVVMSIGVCTIMTGCVFALLGWCRMTKLVQIFPQSVMCGFLASIGEGLFKYSVKIGSGGMHLQKFWLFSEGLITSKFWALYWPVPLLAISLFLLQRDGRASPTLLWSTYLLLPVGVFYAFFGRRTPEELQEEGLLMKAMQPTEFWDVWVYGLQVDMVHWGTVLNAAMTVLPLVPVIVVDVLVAFAATRKAGDLEPEYDDDAVLTGKVFWLQGFLGCPLATNSTKVSLLNFAITGAETRIPELICGFIMIGFFLHPPAISPQDFPNFYLGFLLLFNALGFLVKNLYDSYYHLSGMEFFIPWTMVIVNMNYGLVGAIVSGAVFATGVFAIKYSRLQVVKSVVTGNATRTIDIPITRTSLEDAVLVHSASRQVVVMRLQHYLFFGCVLQVEKVTREILELVAVQEEEGEMPLRWLVMDWSLVEGMDATVPGSFAVAVRKLVRAGLSVVFTGMTAKLERKMRRQAALKQVSNVFTSLVEGIGFVEEQLLLKSAKVREGWIRVGGRAAANAHEIAVMQYNHHVLSFMLHGNLAAVSSCFRIRSLSAGEDVHTVGEPSSSFFVVQTGSMVKMDADDGLLEIMHRGACFNEWALVLDTGAVATCTVRAQSVVVVLELASSSLKELQTHHAAELWQLQKFVLHRKLSQEPTVDRPRDDTVHTAAASFRARLSSVNVETPPTSFERPSARSSLAPGGLRSYNIKSFLARKRMSSSHVPKFPVDAGAVDTISPPLTAIDAKACFERLPKMNGGQMVSVHQVMFALVALGLDARSAAPGRFASQATEATGAFVEQEFVYLALSLPPAAVSLRQAFEKLADKASGVITAASLTRAMPELSKGEVEAMISDGNLGADDGVTFDQFESAIRYVHDDDRSGCLSA